MPGATYFVRLSVFLVLLSLLASAHTRQFQFIGQGLQNMWQNETVWIPTGVPNSTVDDAVISLPQGHLLKISQEVQLHNLTFAGGSLMGSAGKPLRTANLVLLSGGIAGMPIFTGSINTSLCLQQDACTIGFDAINTNTSLYIGTEWVNEGNVYIRNTTVPSFSNLGTCTSYGTLNTTALINHNTFRSVYGDVTTSTLVNYNTFSSSSGSLSTMTLINHNATVIYGALAAPKVFNYGNLTLQSSKPFLIQRLVQYDGYTTAYSFETPLKIVSAHLYGGGIHLATTNAIVQSPIITMNIYGDVKLSIDPLSYQMVMTLFLANNATLQLDIKPYSPLIISSQASLHGALDVSLFTRPSYPWVNGINVFEFLNLDYNGTLKGNEIVVNSAVVGHYVANYTDAVHSSYSTFLLQPDVGYYLNLTSGGGNIPTFNMSLAFAQLMSHPASNVHIQFRLVSGPSTLLDFSPYAVTDENGLASATISSWPEDATTITISAFVTGCYTREDDLCSNVVELVFSPKQSKGLSAGAIVGIVIGVIVAVGVVVLLFALYRRNRYRRIP